MRELPNIPDDFDNLERYAPTLSKINRGNPFSVPENYFEQLPEILKATVLLPEIKPRESFEVPEGYFDKLPSFIQSQAILSDYKKENPFAVPADYFDYLPARIQERIAALDQKSRWWEWLGNLFSPKYLMPATIAVVIAVVSIGYLRTQADLSTSGKPQMSQLDKRELIESVEEFDEAYLINEISDEMPDVSSPSNEDENIINYLIENDVELNSVIKDL